MYPNCVCPSVQQFGLSQAQRGLIRLINDSSSTQTVDVYVGTPYQYVARYSLSPGYSIESINLGTPNTIVLPEGFNYGAGQMIKFTIPGWTSVCELEAIIAEMYPMMSGRDYTVYVNDVLKNCRSRLS